MKLGAGSAGMLGFGASVVVALGFSLPFDARLMRRLRSSGKAGDGTSGTSLLGRCEAVTVDDLDLGVGDAEGPLSATIWPRGASRTESALDNLRHNCFRELLREGMVGRRGGLVSASSVGDAEDDVEAQRVRSGTIGEAVMALFARCGGGGGGRRGRLGGRVFPTVSRSKARLMAPEDAFSRSMMRSASVRPSAKVACGSPSHNAPFFPAPVEFGCESRSILLAGTTTPCWAVTTSPTEKVEYIELVVMDAAPNEVDRKRIIGGRVRRRTLSVLSGVLNATDRRDNVSGFAPASRVTEPVVSSVVSVGFGGRLALVVEVEEEVLLVTAEVVVLHVGEDGLEGNLSEGHDPSSRCGAC